MQRKDRVYEVLRSLCTQRPAQRSALRRHAGFSAEEVAEQAGIDRTNASRDLNLLAQEGLIERIPGRPVLFTLKTPLTAGLPASPEPGEVNQQPALAATRPFQEKEEEAKPPSIEASVQVGAVVTSFETLIGNTEGLKVAVQQAKAAILYPPRGLHTLLCGPSGVGKTTLARLMHAFAVEMKTLPAEAPFVSFNCADYAGNPQLLMAHLFGVVRGAYTGADRDREGLVEQANHGILFLDEVHRLPPEGQEMLFYLMDRERFRRLGDVRERQASLLLLAATTEDPATALLPTFRRRIPMTIVLPGLHERTVTERYELIRAFFTTECSSIGVNIHVAPQVLRALLLYDCPGNIGQLRTDIQLICAQAYLEYRSGNLAEMDVHVASLPEHVRRGLLRTADMHRLLGPLLPRLEFTHIFTPTGLSLDGFPGAAHDLYDTISSEIAVLRNSGLHKDEIHRLLQQNIQHYFQCFADSVTQERSEAHAHLVDERIAVVSNSVVQLAGEQLGRRFPEKLSLVLAMHLTSALERIAQGRSLAGPAFQSMRQTYPAEYEVARTALLRVHAALNVRLPESEADVLTVLFAHAETLLSTAQAGVGIVIAAHGRGIAASLAELANVLVGVNAISAVELTLEQSPDELLAQVEHCVIRADQGSGVLLLVDFASLLSLGDLISRRTGIQTRTVSGVCAPLVVEAVRRAQRAQYLSLDQLAASLAQSRFTDESGQLRSGGGDDHEQLQAELRPTSVLSPDSSRVILSVCLTGYGSATKMAELIEEHLPELKRQGIEIICLDINISGKTEAEVQRIVGERQVIAVVGTINPHLESYPFISLSEMLFGDGIARLRTLSGSTLIDPALLQPAVQPATPVFTQRDELIREIAQTLNRRLLFLNPTRALPLLERMIEMIEVEVGETFEMDVLAGLILHLACILESSVRRGGQPCLLVNADLRARIEQQFARELDICRRAWQALGERMGRALPDVEAYNIVGILRQIDIFALNTT
ncbi:MAG: sigma 54-interacting transcriptional regulator [Ktedonobacteraceae bacterium]|nr:sigma 54-interacting transcriptional regulator [Ktedonobacteraceae bacterium]